MSADGPEDSAIGHLRSGRPFVHRSLHPIWHWHRANVPTFTNQIDYCPVSLADLHILHSQGRQFCST